MAARGAAGLAVGGESAGGVQVEIINAGVTERRSRNPGDEQKTFWPPMTRIWRIKDGIPSTIRGLREIRGYLLKVELLNSSPHNKRYGWCNTEGTELRRRIFDHGFHA